MTDNHVMYNITTRIILAIRVVCCMCISTKVVTVPNNDGVSCNKAKMCLLHQCYTDKNLTCKLRLMFYIEKQHFTISMNISENDPK